jgi:PAS domain S-box-containing protein
MSHKEKISSTNKGFYFLILIVGIIVAAAIMYSLFIGVRINLIYTTLLNSSLDIKANVNNARVELLRALNDTSSAGIKTSWGYLEVAEFNTQIILEERKNLSLFLFPLDESKLQQEVQKLQVMLLELKDTSNKLSEKDQYKKPNFSYETWEALSGKVKAQSDIVEGELHKILFSFDKIFRISQLILIAASLTLCIISSFIFYRLKKQKIEFRRKLEDTTIDVKKRMIRTTRVEEALQESQRKLTTLVQNLPGMVYRCKIGQIWVFDYVSDKSLMITGYKADELINNKLLSYYDLINPDDKKKIFEQIHKAVEEKKSYQLVYRIKTAGGYEKWVWEQGVAVFSENDDEFVALEGFITDITEQKTVEDQFALQGSALEAAANGIVITDKDGYAIWANSAFTKLTGYSLKEMLDSNMNILKTGSNTKDFYEYMWNKISAGETWYGEINNKRKDGSIYNEEMTVTPIKNSLEEIIYFVAVKQDISERKKAEEALRESEIRFRGLYENATIGIYRSALDGKVLMANPTLLKIFSCENLDELQAIKYADPATRDIYRNELQTKGKLFGFESIWKKRDGSIIYIRESARAVKDINENIVFYEGTIEDISDKKKTEEALIEAKEHAEQSDRLKSDFLAQMSHEIRTPLNVILSFADIMKEELQDQVDPELKNAFDVINSEGKRIMRTVELILNMSELQTGSYSPRYKRMDLYKDILQKTVHAFQTTADRKNILFRLYCEVDKPVINGDEYSISQIFNHLVDNAIKYTQKGKVEIYIKLNSNNEFFVEVSDTGIGIGEDYKSLMYTPFTREEQGYTRNFEGNGLGLALVKKYCELNGAEINLNSVKGQGTTFRVTFPKQN